jgi:hypothetical protein
MSGARSWSRSTCAAQGITGGQLTIHAGRGSSMTSKPVTFLFADLGVTQSHSRPHVPNDNPFSEGQFKTPEVPAGLPPPVHLDRSSPRPLPAVLPLVQRRSSSWRPRLAAEEAPVVLVRPEAREGEQRQRLVAGTFRRQEIGMMLPVDDAGDDLGLS